MNTGRRGRPRAKTPGPARPPPRPPPRGGAPPPPRGGPPPPTPPAQADAAERRRLLCALLGRGGATANIQPPFYCDYGSHLSLGEKVFFNFNCVVLDVCPVTIGDFSQLGPGVQLLTPLHPLDAEQRRREEYGRPIEIGADVWVGGGAIILPGVRIGARTVIGAGSVVTRDLPEGVLAVGNPCRVVRRLDAPR
ncbi:MAG: sugar O-acetyltransferase [Archangiaceae bacterium]|nr:sugar O-acetyltransferase [Archangiaceae bacterium]